MLATPNRNSIVFQGVPEIVQIRLSRAFGEAKAVYSEFEAAVIAIPDGKYNLQIHAGPGRTFLEERISRKSPVKDFKRVVQKRLSHSS